MKELLQRINLLSERHFSDENDAIDTVSVDVPLLIRLLEYAKEDAKTDMDLHRVAERLISLNKKKSTLTMSDYNFLVNGAKKIELLDGQK